MAQHFFEWNAGTSAATARVDGAAAVLARKRVEVVVVAIRRQDPLRGYLRDEPFGDSEPVAVRGLDPATP